MEDGDDSQMDEEKVPVKVGRGRSIQFLHLLACSLCLKLYAFIKMQTLIYKLRIYTHKWCSQIFIPAQVRANFVNSM